MYKSLGAILVGLGLLVGGWGGLYYATHFRIDTDIAHAAGTENHDEPVMPILGVLSIVVGAAVIVFDRTE
jgi:hypothetical protein